MFEIMHADALRAFRPKRGTAEFASRLIGPREISRKQIGENQTEIEQQYRSRCAEILPVRWSTKSGAGSARQMWIEVAEAWRESRCVFTQLV
jgi:hypothetical protein